MADPKVKYEFEVQVVFQTKVVKVKVYEDQAAAHDELTATKYAKDVALERVHDSLNEEPEQTAKIVGAHVLSWKRIPSP